MGVDKRHIQAIHHLYGVRFYNLPVPISALMDNLIHSFTNKSS